MNELHRLATSIVVLCGGAVAAIPGTASASRVSANEGLVKLLGCNGKTVEKPAFFVIACGDGYTELTKTHWTSWAKTGAVGVTTFGLNLCKPYCAASRISFFPKSTVVLSEPRETKHGELFSKLVVTYKLHGVTERSTLSWVGDPSF